MKKSAAFFLVVLAVMCFARPAVATTPQCQAWLGAWTFTYGDNGTNPDAGLQPVRITRVCDVEDKTGICDNGGSDVYTCRAYGTRLFDGNPVTLIAVIYDTTSIYYYELVSPPQTPLGAKIPNPLPPYETFTAFNPNNRFLLVSGVKDADCVDADLDGYGAGCNAGPDCNDNNAAIHPGVADNTCNNIDENCSGAADEGYVAPPTSCGVGACSGNAGVLWLSSWLAGRHLRSSGGSNGRYELRRH